MSGEPGKTLSRFDAICLMVGIIIGAGIYETTPAVAGCMGDGPGVLAVWAVGGLIALAGALSYAELATAYPRQGGDYVYLSLAYGRLAGFMFGWSQVVIIRPGDIALMAYVFARYASSLYHPFPGSTVLFAALIVVGLTALNILGVQKGKWTQNVLTTVKVIGLLFIVVSGLTASGGTPAAAAPPARETAPALAMILVLFTYGGWNEIAYAAEEIRSPFRNIPGALVFAVVTVTVLYLLVNISFLHALGFSGFAASEAVAVDAVAKTLPDLASRTIGIIICISALGAVNGMIFSGARISYALGREHRLFQPVGQWNPRSGTPVNALILQGSISLAIILLTGSFIDTILYSAPVVWLFFLMTGLALFRLRRIAPDLKRPCKVLFYPVTPLIFCIAAAFMFFSSLHYALMRKPVGLLTLACVLIIGLGLYRHAKMADA